METFGPVLLTSCTPVNMKWVFFLEALLLACFVLLSQVTAKVRLTLAHLASYVEEMVMMTG